MRVQYRNDTTGLGTMTAHFDKKIQREDRHSVVTHTSNEDADMKTKLFALHSSLYCVSTVAAQYNIAYYNLLVPCNV